LSTFEGAHRLLLSIFGMAMSIFGELPLPAAVEAGLARLDAEPVLRTADRCPIAASGPNACYRG